MFCVSTWFKLGSGLSGAQGGTVFADPILSKQMAQGKLTKSSIDRFTIVLMGGIAAEAMNYGSSEVSVYYPYDVQSMCAAN